MAPSTTLLLKGTVAFCTSPTTIPRAFAGGSSARPRRDHIGLRLDGDVEALLAGTFEGRVGRTRVDGPAVWDRPAELEVRIRAPNAPSGSPPLRRGRLRRSWDAAGPLGLGSASVVGGGSMPATSASPATRDVGARPRRGEAAKRGTAPGRGSGITMTDRWRVLRIVCLMICAELADSTAGPSASHVQRSTNRGVEAGSCVGPLLRRGVCGQRSPENPRGVMEPGLHCPDRQVDDLGDGREGNPAW